MSKPKHLIVLLPGDGIGPEVVGEAKKVLDVVAEKRKAVVDFEFREELIGGAAIDATGGCPFLKPSKPIFYLILTIVIISSRLWGYVLDLGSGETGQRE